MGVGDPYIACPRQYLSFPSCTGWAPEAEAAARKLFASWLPASWELSGLEGWRAEGPEHSSRRGDQSLSPFGLGELCTADSLFTGTQATDTPEHTAVRVPVPGESTYITGHVPTPLGAG